MSSSNNPSDPPNLVTEFESAFSAMVSTLTNEDTMFDKDPDTLRQEEEKISRFMDLARSLETFFLQRRQLIHAHKPELILKEDTGELKLELVRKEELIRRHFEKIGQWQELLKDMKATGAPAAPAGGAAAAGGPQGTQAAATVGAAAGGPTAAKGSLPIGSPNIAPGAPMLPGAGAPQGGFVPGNNYRMANPGAVGGGGGGMMHDPMSYLERASSNVGTPMSR